MRHSRSAVFMLLAVAFGLGVLRVVVSGQSAERRAAPASRAASGRSVPRTRDGHPDLDGIWNFATMTPLERPAEFAGKPVLTDEEAAKWEKERLAQGNADRRDRPPEQDVALAYNDAWYDRGVHLASIDGKKRTSLIVDPSDGRLPPLTAEAQRRQEQRASARRAHPADGPEDRSLAERCLQFGAGPPILPGPYNNNVQLFYNSSTLVILNEMIHDARMVPLDGRPHLPPQIRLWSGDSRGHWDQDTLVVDTTNFTDKTTVRGSDEKLHLTERFTRVDDRTLLYEFTVDNPTAFTKPWTAAIPMQRVDEPIFEYACHEGNYGLANMLKGARAAERSTTGR